MQRIFFLLLLFSSLNAADSRWSQTAKSRHEEMVKLAQEEEAEQKWNKQYMTGSWNGARIKMAKAGVTLSAEYVTDSLGNPSGGAARGFTYTGSFGLSMNFDFTKAGVTGFSLFSSAVWRTGTSLTQRKIHNQFPVQQDFGSQTVKLNELYLMQTFLDQSIILKAGRLDPCNDFLASPLYWYFVNNGFDGNPISVFFNSEITAYPNPTWGAYLMVKPFKRLSAKFAVYNANSYINENKYHGVNFTFKSTNGVIWITEWCALVNQEKEDHGMPGNYKVGFFYQTGSSLKFTGGSQQGDPCLYFLFDQMVYRRGGADSNQGLTPFVALVLMPNNRNLIPLFVEGGLVFKGLFPQRPEDVASFGYIYGKFSTDQAKVQMSHGIEPQNYETILELDYWIQVNPWLAIVPDMQYIIKPRGLHIPNAYVLGFQASFNL